jgi:hypothetical protein
MKNYFLIVILIIQQTTMHAQNVGIGISNPVRAKLEVNGVAENGSTSAIFGGESTGISLQRDWPSIGFNQYHTGTGGKYIGNGFAAVQYLDPHNGGLFFDLFSNGATNAQTPAPKRVMSLFQSGNILLGSSYSNASFSVSRNPGSEATAWLFGTTHNSVFNFGTAENTFIRAGKNAGTVFINDVPNGKICMGSNSFVGVNTATPGHTLEMRQANGTGLAIVDPNFFNYWELRVSAVESLPAFVFFLNGAQRGFFSPHTGEYSSLSDQRLKTNIRQLPSLLDKVMQLQPVEYEMKDDNPAHKKTFGFVAQDVKKLFPELVHVLRHTATGHKGIDDLHSLNYNGFGILAIKAIQEQQETIQSLQAQVDELRRIINTQMLSEKKTN